MAQFVEDTDEDFFDKLVIDDDDDDDNDLDDVDAKALASVSDLGKLGIKHDLVNEELDSAEIENNNNGIGGTKPHTLSLKEDNHSDTAEALANLSISGLGTGIEDSGKLGTDTSVNDYKTSALSLKEDNHSGKLGTGDVPTEIENRNDYTEVESWNNGIGGTAGGGGGGGVKQVQWSDFGSGSYPDFFNEFGDDSVEQIGKEDNFVSSESNGVVDNSLQVNNVNEYSQQVSQSNLGTKPKRN